MSLVKVEDVSTSSASSDSGSEKNTKYDHLLGKYKFKRKPIVYTTRIDDMDIIVNDLQNVYSIQFLKSIIKESMPIYDPNTFVRPKPYVNRLMSYLILKYKMNMYNSSIKCNSTCRIIPKKHQQIRIFNRKPYDKEDTESNFIESDKSPLYYNNNSSKLESIKIPNSSKPADNCIVMNNDISQKVKVIKRKKAKKNVISPKTNKQTVIDVDKISKYRNTYLISNDEYSMEYDVYYLNRTGEITQHYKTKDKSCKDLKFYYNESNAVKLNHCCWYRKITHLVSNTTVRYLRKPHKCIPENCKCCCKKFVKGITKQTNSEAELFCQDLSPFIVFPNKSVSNVSTLPDHLFSCNENVKVEELQNIPRTYNNLHNTSISTVKNNEEWIRSLFSKPLTGPSTSLSLIKKAFTYSPLRNLRKKCMSYNTDSTKSVVIQINNSGTNIYERYKIGPDGEIEEYYIKDFKDLENYNEEQTKPLNNYGAYANITADVCCWYGRKSFVDKLHLKKLLPDSLKFITSSHKCPEVKCKCCCRFLLKPQNKSNPQIDLILPEHILHTNDNVNETMGLKINFAATTHPKRKNLKYILESSSFVANFQINQNIKKTVDTCTTEILKSPPSTGLLCLPDSTPLYPDINNQTNVPVASLLGHDSPEVETLIKTILKKFKDVQLVVNEEGKISAQLNSTINNLNSEDLQMLVQILAQAQSQVDAINPQIGNFQSESGKAPEQSQFTANNNKLLENSIPQKSLIQKDNKTSTAGHNQDNTIIIEDAVKHKNSSIKTKNHLHNHNFASIMSEKREYYLKAFESFLMLQQNTLTPTIESVYSLVQSKNIPTTKRKAKDEHDISKRIKIVDASELLEPSKGKNNTINTIDSNVPVTCLPESQDLFKPKIIQSTRSIPFVNDKNQQQVFIGSRDDLYKKSTKVLLSTNEKILDFGYLTHHIEVGKEPTKPSVSPYDVEANNGKKDFPGPSKFAHMPQPVAMVSSPLLQSLLKAPKAPLNSENSQAALIKILPTNVIFTPDIPGSSKALCSEKASEVTLDINNTLFRADSAEDVILGV